MNLIYFRKMIRWDPIRKPDKCRPQPSVYKRDLARYEATYKNIRILPNRACQFEDVVTLGVGPPAGANRSSGDLFYERRHRTACGLQHDTVLADEGEGLP